MRRNRKLLEIERYLSRIHVVEVRPLAWHACVKCGSEIKLEPMFRCKYTPHDGILTETVYGCIDCFSGKQQFRKYLECTGKLKTRSELEEEYIRGIK